MSSPAISVVMPVHNGQEFLDASIGSIRAQTLRDFEFVIVDDGSKDRTAEILQWHAAEDPRIRIIAQTPKGIAAALNRGIQAASAPLIARMDADDVAKPERLARQFETLLRHPEAALIGSSYEVIDRASRLQRRVSLPTTPEEIDKTLMQQNCIAHPTVLMRRDCVLDVGGYRAAFLHCEDYDLWLRLGESHDLLNIDEPLLSYREHAAQLTWGDTEQRILSELGARVSARCRRAGAADPAEGIDRIARRHLLDFGLGDAEIETYIVARALDSAREAGRAGNPRAALAAFHLARRQKSLSLPTMLRFWLACARSVF